jgi:hypothetical protein
VIKKSSKRCANVAGNGLSRLTLMASCSPAALNAIVGQRAFIVELSIEDFEALQKLEVNGRKARSIR